MLTCDHWVEFRFSERLITNLSRSVVSYQWKKWVGACHLIGCDVTKRKCVRIASQSKTMLTGEHLSWTCFRYSLNLQSGFLDSCLHSFHGFYDQHELVVIETIIYFSTLTVSVLEMETGYSWISLYSSLPELSTLLLCIPCCLLASDRDWSTQSYFMICDNKITIRLIGLTPLSTTVNHSIFFTKERKMQ